MNIFQKNKHMTKSQKTELNDDEDIYMSDKEFKIIIFRILTKFGRRMN